jgi:hypothetical protein
MSAESQAFSVFFNNYPSQTSKNFGNVYKVIPALCCGATPESPLLCMVVALGLAGSSHHTTTSGMQVAAYAWYDKALGKLNKNLRDRVLVKQDQTLLVVLLLALYEVCLTLHPLKRPEAYLLSDQYVQDVYVDEILVKSYQRSHGPTGSAW